MQRKPLIQTNEGWYVKITYRGKGQRAFGIHEFDTRKEAAGHAKHLRTLANIKHAVPRRVKVTMEELA